MASSSPSLNLRFSPEWMRTGQSTGPNSKHPSNSSISHAAVVAAGASNGAPLPTNGTSTATSNSTGTSGTPNGVNGLATSNGLPSGHSQPVIAPSTGGLLTPAPTGMSPATSLNVNSLSGYSSLLTPVATSQGARLSPKDLSTDFHDPFRYARDDIISIWRATSSLGEGTGWSLGIEVERHDGVVIDLERTPSCAREMTEAEIKLYNAPSLNSRRPSISHAYSHNAGRNSMDRDGEPVGLGILGRRGTGDGSSMALSSGAMRGGGLGGGPTSPLRERFPRRDSSGMNQPYRPRQLSAATTPTIDGAPPLISPRTASSGFGFGGGPGFDGVLGAGEGWGGRKRGALANAGRQGSHLKEIQEKTGGKGIEHESKSLDRGRGQVQLDSSIERSDESTEQDGNDEPGALKEEPAFENWEDDPDVAIQGDNELSQEAHGPNPTVNDLNPAGSLSDRTPNPAEVTWQYLDDQQVKQGPFTPDQLSAWDASGWLRPALRMNRPDYDDILLPLTEWRDKLHALGIVDDKQVFHTWYDPIREVPVNPLEPPPGLAIPQQQQHKNQYLEHKQSPEQMYTLEGITATTETPSVFDALRKAEVHMSTTTSSPFHGTKGTHTPSSVFGGSAADAVFSHSPMGSHRLPMRSGTLETGSSSPASIHATTMDTPFGHSGLGAPRMQQFGALHSQLPSSGSGVFSSLNYSPHNPLPSSLTRAGSQGIASPLAGYSGVVPPYAGVADPNAPSPYGLPQAGGLYGSSAFRQGSFDQQSSTGAPWQAHRANLAPGAGLPTRTGSSASSQSNNPRTSFGGQRSASPAGITDTLGGDIYESVMMPSTNSAIGKNGAAGNVLASHSPQQLYGTLYRTPVQPIPEASPIQQEPVTPLESLTYSAEEEQEPVATEPSDRGAEAPDTNANAQSIHPPLSQPPSVWNIPVQTSEAPAPADTNTNEALSLAAIVSQSTKGKAARKRESAGESTTAAKAATLPNSTSSPEVNQGDNDLSFVPVKKRGSAAHVPTAQAPASHANINSPIITLPSNSNTASSKMTVPLASLITNPPVTNQSPITPAATAPKAWATITTKEEGKGLKEIQEAEEKRARENQKPKQTVITPVTSSAGGSKDDEVATMTWGLPTSLAGARAATGSKDTPSPSTNPPPAVWANAAKAATVIGPKKAMTMKDIQEEEERKRQKEREIVTTAKRVSEKKVVPSPVAPAASGGVWATVGPGGKTTRPSTGGSSASSVPTGIAALPPRPSAAAIASSGMRAPHVSAATSTMNATPAGAPATRRPPSAVAGVNPTTKPATTDESIQGVSADTLKWMRDTLRGRLSKGITVDEVVGLVLMMQEEDDIADTIYQSSTTLPGKRFAAEFIEKRNADKRSGNLSASRPPIAPSTSNVDFAAGASATAQDALGYKVVKKKGKGGKA